MDIVIDGSYNTKERDLIGCGVIIMDKFGFYTEHRFHIKHISASSSFAEWYGLECALNMLSDKIEVDEDEEVHIYTDCQSIVDVMGDRKSVFSKNIMLQKYISRVTSLYTFVRYHKGIKCEVRHVKDYKDTIQATKLHTRAHIKAKSPTAHHKVDNGSVKRNPPKRKSNKVYLQIRLEPVETGKRKWVIYENYAQQYIGKLKSILNRYQKERHDIMMLSEENRLETDKGTKDILKKYIGSV